jgi:hypothetical protein
MGECRQFHGDAIDEVDLCNGNLYRIVNDNDEITSLEFYLSNRKNEMTS